MYTCPNMLTGPVGLVNVHWIYSVNTVYKIWSIISIIYFAMYGADLIGRLFVFI